MLVLKSDYEDCPLTPMPEISGLDFNAHGDVVQLRPAAWVPILSISRSRIDQI